MGSAQIGLIGLAVMGQNLALNVADKGFTIAVYNRTLSKVDQFLRGEARGKNILGAHSLTEFLSQLASPRRILLMVKAGEAVDALIEELLPHLTPGDLLIDGGNSLFTDTERRALFLASRGILFVGAGISGGEEGARQGPSIMVGGILLRGLIYETYFRAYRLMWEELPVVNGWERGGRVTTSRWCTMASNMGICSSSAKRIISSRRPWGLEGKRWENSLRHGIGVPYRVI